LSLAAKGKFETGQGRARQGSKKIKNNKKTVAFGHGHPLVT
jgi:hypothetical protein